MAASRKPPSADAGALAALRSLRGRRVAVGLSGGVDSVVLLHLLHDLAPAFGFRLSAIHVHHGLSPNADGWQRFCAGLCEALGVPFRAARVKVAKDGAGLEAAARRARRAAFARAPADAIALAHHLDDQAETVLLNLLRGAGNAGASGMPAVGALGRKRLLRPLLGLSRAEIVAYARAHRLPWIEDESNADEALTRNFLRRRVGPLLAERFPRWRENLARAARHFAARELDAGQALRAYLRSRGLRAPGEAKLLEMLKQLGGHGARTAIAHDGRLLRVYKGRLHLSRSRATSSGEFASRRWNGEARLALPDLGGELRFRKAKGQGIDARRLKARPVEIRLRAGGERLQPDPRRPRRTLKNLFQEAQVPPWERPRLPLLFCGGELAWAPGLGVDAAWRAAAGAAGIVPEWRRSAR